MIVLISGTNRPGAKTLFVARETERLLKSEGEEVYFINLQDMPASLYSPESYSQKPPEFAAHQKAVLAARGILSVIPEYNGSFPGAYKYFIDMLKFPESLVNAPSAFIGVAAGEWGGLRAVEQAEMVFQYRNAPLFGKRLFIKNIKDVIDGEGRLRDEKVRERLSALVKDFVVFCRRLKLE